MLLVWAVFFQFQNLAQTSVGNIKVSVFTKTDYAAGNQNWDIERDNLGRVFIANNEGLLVYNGINWQLYPVPNKTILRSIAFGPDKKLYAGAQNEFGYYAADDNGKLVYTSLKSRLPKSVNSFADIWNIEVLDNAVFFMASDIIIKYTGKHITVYKSNASWSSLKRHNNKLIAHNLKAGLLVLDNGKWQTLIPQGNLPPGFQINNCISIGKDSSLISTSGQGLFILANKRLQPFILKNVSNEQHFTCLAILDKDKFLVGSYNSGLYKINKNGVVIDKVSASTGLTSNTINCTHTGTDSCTWVGMDNGIALVDWNNPIRKINPESFNNGSGHGATVLNGNLYFALSTGLQWVPIADNADIGTAQLEPKTILKGLTWNVSKWNNQIMAGRDDGLWSITNFQATNISKSTGYWTFQPISTSVPAKIICGNYLGVRLFSEVDGKFIDHGGIKNFIESSRYLEVDGQSIWVSHPYHGLFRIDLNDNSIHKFTVQNGLPTDLDNHVFKLRGKIVFATTGGIYEYENSKNRIIPSSYFQKILGNRAIRYLKEDAQGNIWFVEDKMLGVVDFKEKTPKVKFIPELYNHILSGFENVFPYNSENVLVGSDIGFYNINYSKYTAKKLPYSTYITSVKVFGSKDSVIFGGFGFNEPKKESEINISYKLNSIHFSFATSFISYKPRTEFSYYLEGYDKNWSKWVLQNEKEYTNLPEGHYVLHLKSRYGPSNAFKEVTYTFTILPPWYRTVWAYIAYILIFSLVIYLLLKFQKRKLYKKEQSRMLAEKLKFEEEQRQTNLKYQLKLEKKEKAIIQLMKDNLEIELQHKNVELASTAMNLLQKKAFLSKIAEELNKVYAPIKDFVDASEIRKIIRRLSSEEKLDEEWKQFSIHFNNVHSNFLVTLKEVYPELNAHEMKLCAYLRMNLSSKEIAQLLSISVRGVEISRYRLRKKLKLQPHEDLFQFLFNIKPDENLKSNTIKLDSDPEIL